MKTSRTFGVLTLLFSLALTVRAQIPMSSGSYTQRFDSLATSGTSNPWQNNSTLPGWYAQKTVGSAITTYRADDGASSAPALCSFGSSGSTNRALGSVVSPLSGSIAYGIRFTNNTDSIRSNITVFVTGEQWRDGGTLATQALAFSWQASDSPITNLFTGAWTDFNALDFASPVAGGAAATLNGHLATNRQVFDGIRLDGVEVLPGQELFLRWLDIDDAGSDHGLGIDDLTVNFDDFDIELPVPPTNLLVLVHYNVKGNGAPDWSTNAAQVRAIGREVIYLNPDVITFNEIPLTNTWQLTNWAKDFLSGYAIAANSGTDGFIRSAIASRHPINRSTSWLDGIDLQPFGYTNANPALDNFTRDLFEAEIAVPGYPQPLHVFTTHLKSGSTAEDIARRAGEAGAITNFFRTNILAKYPYAPYLLTGDMNTTNTNSLAIKLLISPPTGLHLTNPRNPFTNSINTWSIQGTVNSRLDYIMPSALLASNIRTSQVFRTDKLTPLPPGLNSGDSAAASDHLPVVMVFNNPYDKPVEIVSFARTEEDVSLTWSSVIGQPYRVEVSTNLETWTSLASGLVTTNATFTFSTNTLEQAEYFRIYRSQ
jgi:endonuclease/exonuclease/phosphatase family metal-dependent hydrolase